MKKFRLEWLVVSVTVNVLLGGTIGYLLVQSWNEDKLDKKKDHAFFRAVVWLGHALEEGREADAKAGIRDYLQIIESRRREYRLESSEWDSAFEELKMKGNLEK